MWEWSHAAVWSGGREGWEGQRPYRCGVAVGHAAALLFASLPFFFFSVACPDRVVRGAVRVAQTPAPLARGAVL